MVGPEAVAAMTVRGVRRRVRRKAWRIAWRAGKAAGDMGLLIGVGCGWVWFVVLEGGRRERWRLVRVLY